MVVDVDDIAATLFEWGGMETLVMAGVGGEVMVNGIVNIAGGQNCVSMLWTDVAESVGCSEVEAKLPE